MVDEVVFLQRLLDEEEIEAVELGEDVGIGEGVRGVRIDLQRDGTEGVPHRGGVGDVAARLDLDLDPHVALVEVPGDGIDEGIRTLLDADGHPARHAIDRRAQVLPERPSLGAEGGVENGEFEPRLHHAVADEGLERRTDIVGAQRAHVEQSRDEPPLRDIPRSSRVLARIQRRGLCDDLAPAVAVGGAGTDHDDLAHRFGAERGREGRDERQVQHPQLHRVESDRRGGAGDRHASAYARAHFLRRPASLRAAYSRRGAERGWAAAHPS